MSVCRSNHPDNVLSIFKSCKFNAGSPPLSRSPFMEILAGERHTLCWIVHTICARFGPCLPFNSSLTSRRQPIKLFIASADELYGPITVIRRDGHIIKKIPWSAFQLKEVDWCRVLDTKTILAVNLCSAPPSDAANML